MSAIERLERSTWDNRVIPQKADIRVLLDSQVETLGALVWLETYLRDTPHHNAPAAANARKVIAKSTGEV